ncbi:hypothetical protein GCM10026982_29270 [Nocardiopsis aegyptia]
MCFPSVTVGLDVDDGSVHMLTGRSAADVSDLAAANGDTGTVVTDGGRADALRRLIGRRWLIASSEPSRWRSVQRARPQPPSWGTRESPAALSPVGSAPLRWYLIGSTALAVVLMSRHSGPTRTRLARIRSLALGPRRQYRTDVAEAGNAVRAVRGVGRVLPLRVACLEEATASALALRWTGYRALWRHGVATDPVRLHAWIEVDGHPVGESDDITDYTPFEEPYE